MTTYGKLIHIDTDNSILPEMLESISNTRVLFSKQ